MDFVFYMKVKTKSKYKILNFAFQFIKNTKLHFGYTDLNCPTTSNVISNSQSVSVEVLQVYLLRQGMIQRKEVTPQMLTEANKVSYQNHH